MALGLISSLIYIGMTVFSCRAISLWRKLDITFDEEEAEDKESSHPVQAEVNEADEATTDILVWFQKLEKVMKS